jgi:pantothenate kinase
MGQWGGGGADAQVNNMLKADLKESMDATGSTHFSGLFNVDDDSKLAVSAFKGSAKQPFVIGVAGGTASGKTTVCDMIIQQLHDHRVILVNQVYTTLCSPLSKNRSCSVGNSCHTFANHGQL